MITVDYDNYLEQQTEWAKSLRRIALDGEPDRACELGEIAATTLRRMLRFSGVSRQSGPWRPMNGAAGARGSVGAAGPHWIAY